VDRLDYALDRRADIERLARFDQAVVLGCDARLRGRAAGKKGTCKADC